MIESIRLINFQKFKDQTIILKAGVNTIVGPTNVGKTSLIRCLRFIALNANIRKHGKHDPMIRKGQEQVTGVLKIDGKTIVRTKGKKGNKYKINGKELAAFGSKVPSEVAKVLNITPANFQRQLDQPFWFSDSPGQVSKNLNEIVNLELMDRSLQNITTKIKRAKIAWELAQEEYYDQKDKLKRAASWIPEFVRQANVICELTSRKAALLDKSLVMADLAKTGVNLTHTLNNATTALLGGKNAMLAGSELKRLTNERQSLEELITEYTHIRNDLEREVPDIGPLLSFRNKADQIAEDRRELEEVVNEGITLTKEIKCLADQLAVAESTLGELPLCTKCGQPLLTTNQ